MRIFVDEGPAMRALLRGAAAAGIVTSFTQRFLAAFDEPPLPVTTPTPGAATGLPVPLTAREVEILRLIAAAMRNQEIADHLVISLATVKRHIANADNKLRATHRTEAIVRANERHLL